MKKNPCKKDCPKRSSDCHGTCKEYEDWKAEHDEIKKKARLDKMGYRNGAGQWTQTPDGYWRNKQLNRR